METTGAGYFENSTNELVQGGQAGGQPAHTLRYPKNVRHKARNSILFGTPLLKAQNY